MIRLAVFAAILPVAVVVAWASVGSPGAALEATPPAPVAAHPVVGAWRFDTNADDPGNPPSYAAFHADGAYMESHPGVGVGIGAWQATGPRTADLTIVFADIDPSEDAFARGELTVRAAVEVDPSGDALTAPYAFSGASLDGAVLFDGVLTATATRIDVEPMPPATPAATPAG